MDKKLMIAIMLVLAIMASGCVQPVVCGNGTCESSETAQDCPQDCASVGLPPTPNEPESNENPPELPF